MADEDEIDILGEFSLENFVSKSGSSIYDHSEALVSQNTDILNCDYTIHPQWLLDRPSANPDNWYDSSNLSTNLTEKSQIEIDSFGHVSTENSITDESGWTDKEKNLLERGIEIFGKSNVRLAQFISSKTASEVKYYLKNFYLENHNARRTNEGIAGNTGKTVLNEDILNDSQIPASMEEVIAAVSTAKPTVNTKTQKVQKRSDSYVDGQVALGQRPWQLPVGVKGKKKVKIYKKRKPGRPATIKCKFRGSELKPKSTLVVPNEDIETQDKGVGLAMAVNEGEEIIKLEKIEDSETDIEVDVVSDDDLPHSTNDIIKTDAEENCSSTITDHTNRQQSVANKVDQLSNIDDVTTKQLTSLDEPTSEVSIDQSIITELEKVINNDFFDGSERKTPTRYMHIRNHILKIWKNLKPKYVGKTISRHGLKNCGDVNCFGRIHQFLEQIGAINFGCEQVKYMRPLTNLIYIPPVPKEKVVKEKIMSRSSNDIRHRVKNKKYTNDGEGGCTLTHDENGHIISTTVVNEEPVTKQKVYMKRPVIKLIYCRPFTVDKPQPYEIKINLATLLTIDFHSHAWLTEVMGLVAGHWIPHKKLLKITHYEPCLNIASSTTHCDMCPISQAKAADVIHQKGLDIVGWFHSHPTFAPEPSQQDLDTQQFVQRWIGHGKPCIGVILSPFSVNGALIASPFRCMVVDQRANFEDQFAPYKFKVDVESEGFDLKTFLQDLRRVHAAEVGCTDERRVDFLKPYYQNVSLSFLEKYITSVRMTLARYGTFEPEFCEKIEKGISAVCR